MKVLAAFAAVMLIASSAEARAGEELDAFALEPRQTRAAVEELLAGMSVEPARVGRTAIELDAKPFATVFERQTVWLHFQRDQTLRRITIRIEPPAFSDGRALLQLHRTVRDALVRRLGAPEWEDAIGSDRTGDALRALADGEIVRTTEWQTDRWRVRAGIPRRTDGRMAIEVALTERSLARGELFWSEP